MATIDYLIVAGGGAGGAGAGSGDSGGGGGGGEVIEVLSASLAVAAYAITVGAASTGAGNDSIIATVRTANGGGLGGDFNAVGNDGGSGGGAGGKTSGGTLSGGASSLSGSGQGTAGGNSTANTGRGAGGGGATIAGSAGGSDGGTGGSGYTTSFDGTSRVFGSGGGGGGGVTGGTAGPNAGNGGTSFGAGSNGTANFGGGGGGSGVGTGGQGGSGRVVLRYLTGHVDATGGTITTSGGYTIHTFTSNGTFTINSAVSPSVSASASSSPSRSPSVSASASASPSISPSASISPSRSASASASASLSPGDFPGAELYVKINGIQRASDKQTASHKVKNAVVVEYRDIDKPNRASFTARGFTPTVGDEVIFTLGGADNPERLFKGRIQSVDARSEETIGNLWYDCVCVDDTYELDLIPIARERFANTSATDIATYLLSTYAPGYTTAYIAADLPMLEEFTLSDERLSRALGRLAKRIEGTCFLGQQEDVHLFTGTESIPSAFHPAEIVITHDSLEAFAVTRDFSQFYTRVEFTGGGSRVLTDLAAGTTSIPVEDASVFPPSGEFVHRFNRCSYDDRHLGGGGSLVGPGAAPSSAPTVVLASGSGVETGEHDYAYVFVTASGKTLPSPIETIDVGFVSAPTSAATAGTPTSGGSMDAGTHQYYPVFRTAAGSTTAGPVSNAVTAEAGISAPGSAVTLFTGGTSRSDGALDDGATYGYAYTYWDGGTRETTASPAATVNLFGGNNAGAILISSIPTPPTGYQVRFYRTEGGAGIYKLLPSGQAFGQFAYSNAGYYIDIKADSTLGANEPASNTTAKGTCAVTGIPVSSEPLVTHVDMYREFDNAGASTAKLAFSVANGVTSSSDTTANASLGATVPSSNTAAANRAAVTFPAGPTGTTDIELHRTAIGSAQLKRFHLVGSNTGGTVTDSTPDASLGINAPSADDSGLDQPDGVVLPGDTSVPVANPNQFEANGGWAITGNGQQVILYTGKSGSALTGVPASGTGAVTAPIQYNSTISPAPFLSGIPASGAGSIAHAITKGEDVNMLVTVNDTDAQTLLASLIGGDGIRVLQDGDRRLSYQESVLRATAILELRSEIDEQLRYRVRDKNSRAGRTVTALLTAYAINDDYRIQEVRIHNFTEALFPFFDVVASRTLFTFEELLRQVRTRAA